jgi:hypothetical protein
MLFAIELDLGAGILTNQNFVARLYVEANTLAIFGATRADGNNESLLWLLFGCVRDDDAPDALLFVFVGALD